MTDFDEQSNVNSPSETGQNDEPYVPLDMRGPFDSANGRPMEATERGDEGGDSENNPSFIFLVVALLALVGGSVYFVGQAMSAGRETAEAEERAEAIIAEFDPDEFQSNFADEDQTPTSLPFVGDPDKSDVVTKSDVVVDLAEIEESGEVDASTTTTTTTVPRDIINAEDIAVAFINRVPGDEYGFVGYIDRFGERRITQLECDRLDRNINGGICLSATAGISGTGVGFLLDSGLAQTKRFGVNQPSRAAVSPSGRIVSWTGFTLGFTYITPGEFETRTQLIDVERGLPANLEDDFETYDADRLLDEDDRNYWGVTFVGDDEFYATLGTQGKTAIVRGRISNSRIEVVFPNATCPEVSPDGKTIVAKEQRGGRFQLVSIDVDTGQRRDLGETRSVDDQVEWLDDDKIVYSVLNAEEGTEAQPVLDIYVLNVAPGSSPRLLIPFADSPAA